MRTSHLSFNRPSTWARPFLGAGAAALGMTFQACMPNAVGSDDLAEDTPTAVTAQIAGQSLGESFEGTKGWEKNLHQPADGALMQAVFGATAQMKAQAKQAALAKGARTSAEAWQIDIDSLAGVVHLSHTSTALGITLEDRVDARWDDKAKDDIHDNETLLRASQTKTYASGKIESALFTDADGDGIINAVTPGSRVKLVLEKKEAGTTETATLVVGCGPDQNFDTENDNTIHVAAWSRKKGQVLQAEAEFSDADGDGTVVDNADTSLVLVQLHEIEPADRPLVQEVKAHAKVRLFGKDKGDEPVNFGYTETLSNGRKHTVSLKNSRGGEEILPDDTLTVHLSAVSTRNDDTLKTMTLDIVMNPGHDLKNETDDVVYAFHITSEKRIGFERHAAFDFWADEPVPHGQEPKAGHFSGEATYANGQKASLSGRFSPKGFSAEYTGPEGNTLAVNYSMGGAMIP